jgi:hypothetical protein
MAAFITHFRANLKRPLRLMCSMTTPPSWETFLPAIEDRLAPPDHVLIAVA